METVRKHKPYNELEFTDDFMFCKIMESNPDICKEVLELILEIEIDEIIEVQSQYQISVNSDLHGIRLDVRVRDKTGRIFNIEMQTTDKKDIPHRCRFYQGSIDVSQLRPGMNYTDLADTYIIFICLFDPIGKGLAKYTFRERCDEDLSISLGSGTTKIIVNAKSSIEKVPEDMKAFLRNLMEHTASSDLTEKIEAQVASAKNFRSWESEYMLFEEKLREEHEAGFEEGRAEGEAAGIVKGRAEGRAEGRADALFSLVRKGLISIEDAAAEEGLSTEEFEALMASN